MICMKSSPTVARLVGKDEAGRGLLGDNLFDVAIALFSRRLMDAVKRPFFTS